MINKNINNNKDDYNSSVNNIFYEKNSKNNCE